MNTHSVVFTPAAREAQAVFRLAMDAMARPGTIAVFPETGHFAAENARPAFALLRALADQEVSLCLVGGDEVAERQARLATGAAGAPCAEAGYVLFLEENAEALAAIRTGSPETPEDGATAILAVRAVGEGPARLRLSGPGIAGETELLVSGFGSAMVAARNRACGAYPLGIDLFLVDGSGRCVGLPRTTTITTREA